MSFINKYINSLKKKDTILAFMVSSAIYYQENKNILFSIIFSLKFVLIFLFFLNFF
jgi:hypothetical protein